MAQGSSGLGKDPPWNEMEDEERLKELGREDL